MTPSTVYAGTNGGVFKSTDGGETWTARNTGLATLDVRSLDVRALAIDPKTPTTVYAGADVGVFKSLDGGGTWTAGNTDPDLTNPNVLALAIDPRTPSTVYAGTLGGGIFKRTGN